MKPTPPTPVADAEAASSMHLFPSSNRLTGSPFQSGCDVHVWPRCLQCSLRCTQPIHASAIRVEEYNNRILAHPASTVPSQQEQGYFARTLCSTIGLTIHYLAFFH